MPQSPESPAQVGEVRPVDLRVSLLREMSSWEDPVLSPEPTTKSTGGFNYPKALAILGGRAGEEIDVLDHLADLDLLLREFSDRVHLCPLCSSFAINFREACPRCEAGNIYVEDMLHHYRCGHLGPAAEFRDGARQACPKCRRALRHIGVDYERPSSNYLCCGCRFIFREPKVSCRCHACGGKFPVEQAIKRTIHAFRLTTKGALAAAQGEIAETMDGRRLLDASFGIYTTGFLEERLAQEIARARRHHYPLTLVVTALDHLDAIQRSVGREAAAALFRDVARVVKEATRAGDMVALADAGTFAVLLPDTSIEKGHFLAARLSNEVKALDSRGPTLSIGMAECTDDVEQPAQMVAAARRRLEDARSDGGNCVRPARE